MLKTCKEPAVHDAECDHGKHEQSQCNYALWCSLMELRLRPLSVVLIIVVRSYVENR